MYSILPRWYRGVAFRLLTAAAAGLAVCCAAADASAQSGKGDYLGVWSVSGGLGYAIPNTDEYGNSLAWRFGIGYSPVPQFEIGLDVGRFATEVTQPEAEGGRPNHDIASGRIEVLPVCVTAQLHLPVPQTMATFNVLAGAGYYFVDYSMDEAQRALFAAEGEGLPDQAVDDAWGFHAGAGMEYALTSWLSLTAEGRYILLAPKVSGTAAEGYQLGGTLNLNTWLFTGGIKVAF